MQRIRVHSSGRFLCLEDGSPFFWMGDTAWQLFHKLSREEAVQYLQTRRDQGYTVIQALALGTYDGPRAANVYGRTALKKTNDSFWPLTPDTDGEYSYWDHVDFIIREAAKLGLYIALLPTWGDKVNRYKGNDPELFYHTETAYNYGKWLGARYRDDENIVWVMGGDRAMDMRRHFEVELAMVNGLKEGDGGQNIFTFHPEGLHSSAPLMHEEEWLAFNMLQSCHTQRSYPSYEMVEADYARIPAKPVLDAEPCYEDHPLDFKANNDYFGATDVRKIAYWGVFAGACGHTYGHHCVWSMNRESTDYFLMTWQEAMDRPGATQMQHLRRLIESRPFFERKPAQEMLVEEVRGGSNHARATRGERYAFIYTPHSMNLAVKLGQLPGKQLKAQWYDPRTGETTDIGLIDNEGERVFTTPRHGWEFDYVLILDSVD